MRGARDLNRLFLALAIGAVLAVAARAAPPASEPDPGYQLQPQELQAVTRAVAAELADPGSARFSDLLARQAPPPSRSVNVCGFVETHATNGAQAGKSPFMVSFLRPPKTASGDEGLRVTIVGIGAPSDVGGSYIVCKVCEESNLPICP
jgi:hypothetical protein